MNVEQILNRLDELLDKSLSLPLSGGRVVVDADSVRDMIDDIRINLPTEIKQARAIVSDREEILAAAEREGEAIIRKAEERAKALMSREEVVVQAQARGSELLSHAQGKAREVRQASYDFSEDMLRTLEESLARTIGEVRSTRQALRQSSRQRS